MFAYKGLFLTMLHSVPQHLLQGMPSLVLGLTAGYCSVLLFHGPSPFFYGLLELFITVAIAYGLAIGARVGIRAGTTALQQLANCGWSGKEMVSTSRERMVDVSEMLD